MGVVTVSSSASRTTPLGAGAGFPARRSSDIRRPFFVVAFKTDRTKCSSFVAPQEPATKPLEKEAQKSLTKARKKQPKRVKAVSVDATAPSSSSSSSDSCAVDLDYNEVAAALENIYKLSPPADESDVEDVGRGRTRNRKRRVKEGDGELGIVVRNRKRRVKPLSLDKRITLSRRRQKEDGEIVEGEEGVSSKNKREEGDEDVERMVREYSVSTDLVSLDWRRMKIPPVLCSSKQAWLFKLMQPMKAIFKVKENLNKEPRDAELAAGVNLSVPQLRRHVEVGQAARNKLIKHNLRLVLFVINKYYQEIASGGKFQDLCQAGAKGLITAIDRFEPKRGFRLSTYGLFWIRHSITRSMTVSSFTRVSFGIESVRQEIQKAKLELMFELQRLPTDEEIIDRVGISPKRYREVMKASKLVFSLNARHAVTQEEFINGISDIDGVGGDNHRQPALLRLALDDVLDSLKPKESLVIRQRYGLDGKGDRTLGEIAGNLNISREMVRKHELKALMKLKHPARLDYLRRYI